MDLINQNVHIYISDGINKHFLICKLLILDKIRFIDLKIFASKTLHFKWSDILYEKLEESQVKIFEIFLEHHLNLKFCQSLGFCDTNWTLVKKTTGQLVEEYTPLSDNVAMYDEIHVVVVGEEHSRCCIGKRGKFLCSPCTAGGLLHI